MMPLRSSLILLALSLAAPAAAMMTGESSNPQTIAARFFADPALGETRALVVLKDGVPVIERYAPGYGPANRFISWSMAKSITSTLAGMMIGDGKLALDAPAPVAAWKKPGDPRGAITLRQLLHMSSGLQHDEIGDPGVEHSDTNRALFGDRAADMAAAAAAAPMIAKPDTVYTYSSVSTILIDALIVAAAAPDAKTPAARAAAMRTLLADRLAKPAGMTSLICEFDAAGTMIGGSFCHASARDWARFGQLYLDGGKANGVQVVPPAWVDFVRTPAPTNPSYGGHFWLNRMNPKAKRQALFAEQGPPDAYAAIGHLGQYVIVVPSKHLVVVRLGKTQDDNLVPVKAALGHLVNAFPDIP